MGHFNPYDPACAFDDVAGFVGAGSYYGPVIGGQSARNSLAVAGSILRRARSRKRTKGQSRVIVGVTDTTSRTFRSRLRKTIVGDGGFRNTPVYDNLYREFAANLPDPKLARVDDVNTYADFRSVRREPYLAQLESRLSVLESALDEHVNHDFDVEKELRKILEECMRGGQTISLPVPETRTGQLECWQDGDEILCTIRLVCSDGVVRMVTSGTPVSEHTDEVVGCAVLEGLDADDVLAVGPSVVQVLGAAKLAEEMFVAAPMTIEVCGGRTGITIGLVPVTDPALAATMSLLQRCQRGDWTAIADAKKIAAIRPQVIGEAAKRLTMAQRWKAGRRS